MKKQIRPMSALLLLSLLTWSCSNVMQQKPGTEAEGTGTVVISLSLPGEAAGTPENARTILPGNTAISDLYYTLVFTSGENTVNDVISAGLTKTVPLSVGTWNLTVLGFLSPADKDDSTKAVLQGNASVEVDSTTPLQTQVLLEGFRTAEGRGQLGYTLQFPDSVSYATLTVSDINGGSPVTRDLFIENAANTLGAEGALVEARGNFAPLSSGYYQVTLDLYQSGTGKTARKSETLNIYDGLTSTLEWSFTADSGFYDGATNQAISGSLSSTLTALLAGPSGDYTVILYEDQRCGPMTLTTTSGKDIYITLRGNGHTINLDSAGSLFTLGSGTSGSNYGNITLILQDITLSGKPDNTGALVRVYTDKTVIMSSGARIINNSSSSSSGGGVYNSGTFIMQGGAISGNTSSSGGGVYIAGSGTFTMQGGAISGNTASSSGGGVYNSGTFTKIGGIIYGADAPIETPALKNTAGGQGQAVYAGTDKVRNTTADELVSLDSALRGMDGGFEGSVAFTVIDNSEWDLIVQNRAVEKDTQTLFSMSESYDSYQWYLDGSLAGTDSTYTFDTTGHRDGEVFELAVMVTGSNAEQRSGRCRITIMPLLPLQHTDAVLLSINTEQTLTLAANSSPLYYFLADTVGSYTVVLYDHDNPGTVGGTYVDCEWTVYRDDGTQTFWESTDNVLDRGGSTRTINASSPGYIIIGVTPYNRGGSGRFGLKYSKVGN